MKAWLSLRRDVSRIEAFAAGFRRLGYAVEHGVTAKPGADDVLCIWNRSGDNARAAVAFEARGCPVLVAENGYLGGAPAGERWYALSVGQHNGAGRWPHGGAERWSAMRIELQPWRGAGETVVLAQRGIGEPPVAMPRDWPQRVAHLGRVRLHPGQRAAVPLHEDLRRAGAVVTWGSAAALQALVLGIPVFHAFTRWIGAPAARPLKEIAAGPRRDDAARLAMFERLAWAQWRATEVARGDALDALLEIGR